MLTLYRPGSGLFHRLPAGPKLGTIIALILAISFLPSTWLGAGISTGGVLIVYLLARPRDGEYGVIELGRQVVAVRWILGFTLISQWVFLTPEQAVSNTCRVTAALALAALLTLTTRVSELMTTLESCLKPTRFVGVRPERVALMVTVALSTIPTLTRFAREIRDAHHARGVRMRPQTVIVPFIVAALKHADALGDGLRARGVDD